MTDEYIVRTGIKEQLAQAVAELISVRPKVPVRFLATHFQPVDSSNKIAKCAAILQNSEPRLPAFRDAVERAMCLLAKTNATAPSVISIIVPTPATRTTISAYSVDRADFTELVAFLCVDLAQDWTQSVMEALRLTHEKEAEISATVSIEEFEHGVRTCLLLEELLDTLDQLFHLADKSESGQISTQALLATLDGAAAVAQAQPESSMDGLLALLHSAFSHDEPSEENRSDTVRWPELLAIIARVVFAP